MTTNLVYPAPLAETSAALRDGQMDVHDHIDVVCDRIEQVDPLIKALLAEPDRRGRLHRAATALAAAYTEPAGRTSRKRIAPGFAVGGSLRGR